MILEVVTIVEYTRYGRTPPIINDILVASGFLATVSYKAWNLDFKSVGRVFGTATTFRREALPSRLLTHDSPQSFFNANMCKIIV